MPPIKVRSGSRSDWRQISATSARGSPQPGGIITFMPGRSSATAALGVILAKARVIAQVYTPSGVARAGIIWRDDPSLLGPGLDPRRRRLDRRLHHRVVTAAPRLP